MDQSVNQQFEEFKTHGKLPSPRGAALQVIQLTQRDDSTAKQVARLINNDPALAGQILKAANLLAHREGRPLASIVDAVTVLGMKSIRQLALSLSLVADFQTGVCEGFDYPKFWAHSVCSAITARELVSRIQIGVADEAFLLGLLAQIGRLTLSTVFPEQYSRVLKQTDSGQSLKELERHAFGLDHGQITALMLEDWGMPALFQTIAAHVEEAETSPFKDGSRNWQLLQLFHFADKLADLSTSAPAQRYQKIPYLMLLATRLGIETNTLIEIGDLVTQGLHEWSALLDIATPDLPPFRELLDADSTTSLELTGSVALDAGQPGLFKLRILLVDDERSFQLLYRRLLEKAGHHVTTANTGREALEIVKNDPPHLVISDWMMPEMDGIELSKELRKKPEWNKIYIFIITSQESTDRLVEAFEAGVDDYLSKPIDPKVLAARLRAAQRIIHMQETLEQDRLQLRRFADELALSNQRLQELALTDVLTGLPNRRYGIERLEQELAISVRQNKPVCCMMIDIDHFKLINDNYGHNIGDEALKMVSASLRHAARKQDVVFRLGGEEFLVISANTDEQACFQYAERLRLQVASQPLQIEGNTLRITVSIGISSNARAKSVESMLSLADERLYTAKASGRNCTMPQNLI